MVEAARIVTTDAEIDETCRTSCHLWNAFQPSPSITER
jgi:hypothetical protein